LVSSRTYAIKYAPAVAQHKVPCAHILNGVTAFTAADRFVKRKEIYRMPIMNGQTITRLRY
jgi:hypothetical protein